MFSFWFLNLRVGDEHTLRVPTARDWRSQSRFQVSFLRPVSERPLLELLNEIIRSCCNHYGKSSVLRGRYVSAATQRYRFPCFLDLLWQPTLSTQAWLGVSSRLRLGDEIQTVSNLSGSTASPRPVGRLCCVRSGH